MRIGYYKAFGLTIESCFPIPQVPQIEPCQCDVRVESADLSVLPAEHRRTVTENGVYFRSPGQGTFYITNGDRIQIDPDPDHTPAHLAIFIMGSAMGAILHQRGFLPIHGSCVTDGKHSILLTGESGAGKSTLAAEFISRGWKLVTDDVTCITNFDGTPVVRSSYPSQKLWEDALARYETEEDNIHSLYSRQDREKFGIDVSAHFFDGEAPLSLVIRLINGPVRCALAPMEGMVKTDQLIRNTYRGQIIEQRNLQRHFQRCVTLSTKIPMAVVTRTDGEDCAGRMYELITTFLEEQYHD